MQGGAGTCDIDPVPRRGHDRTESRRRGNIERHFLIESLKVETRQ
jgi:hypothetical protein